MTEKDVYQFYNDDEYTKLLELKTDLRFVDNGKYLPSLLGKRKAIIELAKEARISESSENIDDAFEKWYEVSGLIDQFEKEFFDPSKIQWAKKVNFIYNLWSFIIGVVAGIISSAIVQYLFPGIFRFLHRQ